MTSRTAGAAAVVVLLAIGGGHVYQALKLSRGTMAEPGPGLFPLFVGGLMCVACLICLWRVATEPEPAEMHLRADATRLTMLVAALAAFIVLLPRVGFVAPALLLQVVTLQVFGMRGLWRRVAVAAVATAAAMLLFETLLGVRFPAPTWGL